MSELLLLMKLYLGVDPLDLTRDAELTAYINRAIGMIEAYLGRGILTAAYTDSLDVPGEHIKVKNWPLVTLTELKLDGEVQDLAELRLYLDLGMIKKISGFCLVSMRGCFAEFSYTGGYPDPLPVWLEESIIQTALSIKNDTESGGGGSSGNLKRESVQGVYSVEYETGNTSSSSVEGNFSPGSLPDSVLTILESQKEPIMEG